MRLVCFPLLWAGLLAISALSCAQSTVVDVSTPATLPAPLVTAVNAVGEAAEGMGTLGVFRLEVGESEARLVPERQAALTDTLEIIDITSFLSSGPCFDCARVEGFRRVDAEHIGLTIAIRHPFPAGDASLPISGSNRADLHVFNVEGQLLSDRAATNFPGSSMRVVDGLLSNADGYSAYLDPVIDPTFLTEATAHPYRLHFADYSLGNFDPGNPTGFTSITTPPPSGNLVMPQGSDWDALEYILDLSVGPTELRFVIGCTFGVSASNRFARFTPEYRAPQHLKKAASEVAVNVLSNDLEAGIAGSSASLEVSVLDPSHGVPVGSALNEMAADSSIALVRVDCPGLLTAPIELSGTTGAGSGHSPADPWLATVNIANQLLAGEGEYPVLISVIDSYFPGQNTAPVLNGKDAIGPVPVGANPLTGLFDLSTFATYQTVSLSVQAISNPLPNWPLYMGNSAHQGGLGLPGPTGTFTTPTWTSGCADWNCWGNPLPIFLDDTTAYFSNTGDGGSLPCQAVDLATHQVKWTQLFNDLPQNWLNAKGISITPEGTVVLCHENKTGHLYGLDGADGSQLWQIPAWGHSRSDGYATTDDAGNFILASAYSIGGDPDGPEGYYSFAPRTGAINWYAPVGPPGYGTPAFANDTIYATIDTPSNLLALNPDDGSLKWTFPNIGIQRSNAVSVHPDGGVLIHTMNGLYCIDDAGTSGVQRWLQPYTCPFYTGASIGPDGTIHLIDYDNTFRRLDPLTGLTVASAPNWEDGYAARIVVDAAGISYFPYRDDVLNLSYFVALNPDGSLKWRYTAGAWIGAAGIPSAGALGKDGTLYTSVRHSGLVAFRDA